MSTVIITTLKILRLSLLCNPKIISKWRRDLGYPTLGRGFRRSRSSEFKHEVCQYYDNHTQGMERSLVFQRFHCLGGVENSVNRNKSLGYNLYMESLQRMQKRQSHDIVMTKMENGDLKGRIAVLEVKLKDATYLLEQVVQDLNGKDLM